MNHFRLAACFSNRAIGSTARPNTKKALRTRRVVAQVIDRVSIIVGYVVRFIVHRKGFLSIYAFISSLKTPSAFASNVHTRMHSLYICIHVLNRAIKKNRLILKSFFNSFTRTIASLNIYRTKTTRCYVARSNHDDVARAILLTRNSINV